MYLDSIVHSAFSSVHVYRTTWCPSIDALMRVPLFSVSAAGPNVLSPHKGKYRCTQRTQSARTVMTVRCLFTVD